MLVDRKVSEYPSISCSTNSIDGVVDFSKQLTEFCNKHNIDKRRTYYISLCLEEMGVNIIKHGFTKMKTPKNGVIDLFAQIEGDTVSVRLRDNATEFNPNERLKLIEHESADISKNIGIKIVNKLQKEMKYQRLLKKNILIIRI